ncbi:MAG: DUF4440 domain-containing protein [Candidatus Latescibacteria bacterium]|nr:DUF4440 domain-containing protein [bacterium]MBD3424339.1 DUF4440 domain-containing protein [Candidatus Latescibacterota bacterium]
MLSREEMDSAVKKWMKAWNRHDLEGVMALFHDDVIFENWSGGRVRGKRNLRRVWKPWFNENGGFEFETIGILLDTESQQALLRWKLYWPSRLQGYRGKTEEREGLDVLHFRGGLIDLKLTYTKTAVEIDGRKVRLSPETD